MKYEGKGKGVVLSRKEMKAIAKQRSDEQKCEAINEELLKNAAFEAGITIEEYQLFLKNLESEQMIQQANINGIKEIKDSCDLAAEDFAMRWIQKKKKKEKLKEKKVK